MTHLVNIFWRYHVVFSTVSWLTVIVTFVVGTDSEPTRNGYAHGWSRIYHRDPVEVH